MTAVSEDATADLNRRIAELEQRLELALIERDAAVERQTASALVNFRLQSELRSTAERQNASAEILRTIANTRGSAEHALQRIAETTAHFFNAAGVAIRVAEGDEWVQAIRVGAGAQLTGEQPATQLMTRGANLPATVYLDNRQIHIPDLDNIDASMADWPATAARAAGIRTMCGTPLRRADKAIGALIVYRDRLAAFTDDELALQQSFADQAAIAIENARLFKETQEALERQTATSDILRVIAGSPSDVQPVFAAIAERSNMLLRGLATAVYSLVDNMQHLMAFTPTSPAADAALKSMFPRHVSEVFWIETIRKGEIFRIADAEVDLPTLPSMREVARLRGWRSALLVPLMRDQTAIGHITVTRAEPGPFADHDVQLLKTFADQAVIAIENARLFNETQEALERQTATSEILKVIASSPSDVQPVFDAIAESARRVVGGHSSLVTRIVGDDLHSAAFTTGSDAGKEALARLFPVALSSPRTLPRVARTGQTVIFADTERDADDSGKEVARARGYRSMLAVPMLRDGVPIGTISVTRAEPGGFDDNAVGLLKTFADQAVIAIENTRLFNETQEALERQTATADILKVIASSPSDVQPVFDAIATSSNRLLGGFSCTVVRFIDGMAHLKAFTPTTPEADALLQSGFPQPVSGFAPFQNADAGEVTQIPDTEAMTGPILNVARARGFRSMLFAPLVSKGEAIGAIGVTRVQVGRFADHHVQLLKTFADQAVIAIENTRLFNEVQARTHELSEALEQQTATSEVLSVISSSAGDLAPVFDAMLAKAMQLCSANFGVLNTYDGQQFRTGATYGLPPAYDDFRRNRPLDYGPGTAPARLLQGEPFVEIEDLLESEAYRSGDPNRVALVDLGGARCLLAVPLLKDERVVGNVMIFRQEKRPFSQKQITLLQQFAAQAVIAIENTRLLRELRQSTEDLSESLQQQTATSEVLQIISSSPSDLAPVFDKMLENATRICGAEFGSMMLIEDGAARQAALYNAPAPLAAARADKVFRPPPQGPLATVIRTRQAVQVADMRTTPGYLERNQTTLELVDLAGARTVALVPMLREDDVIGTITIYRQEVRPFSDKQIELVSNFAKQAVIAIENARLLRELRRRTDDLTEALTFQTGSANILRVIASSPTNVDPVLQSIVESACELCDADDAVVLLQDGEYLRFRAHHGPIGINVERWPVNRKWVAGRAFLDQKPVHVHDIFSDDNPDFSDARELSRHVGARSANIHSVLGVPLLREKESIGTILLRRIEVRPFDEKQINLLQTFADQAVIAIGNVRLFDEVQARTRELSESLHFQTAASDVLKVISRSPDRLQPVLDVIVETSRELCGSDGATIFLLKEEKFHLTAVSGALPGHLEFMLANPVAIGQPGSILNRVLGEKHSLHVPNVMDDPELREGSVAIGGPRALLAAPLMREREVVGVIILRQSHLKPFTPRQVQAIETFADQAVIAISNVNLFEQVQQRTRELAKSLDDLRTAQDRLIQTEKLASLGQLTAGIAHEIKNPLNFVNNFAALSAELTDELKQALTPAALDETIRAEVDELTGTLKSNLDKVVQHGKRADSIVKNMLLHSREGTGEHRPADVNALVDESLNLAYHGARAEKPQFNVTLKRDFDPEAGMVEMFPQEITRVLLNLISNGFYAVTRRKADNDGADFEPLVIATTRGAADHVEICIRDNGTGIPPDVKEKMFNPFFTTKPAGEGTGLGLSMSHDIIVKQHGGSIEVETEPGAFTEFRLVLPRTSLSGKAAGN
jgi:GAF domain-containing protein